MTATINDVVNILNITVLITAIIVVAVVVIFSYALHVFVHVDTLHPVLESFYCLRLYCHLFAILYDISLSPYALLSVSSLLFPSSFHCCRCCRNVVFAGVLIALSFLLISVAYASTCVHRTANRVIGAKANKRYRNAQRCQSYVRVFVSAGV